MNTDFPFLCFLKISQECREQVVNDVFSCDPDLYSALYSNLESEIFNIKYEIYELKWIESHWKKIIEVLEKKVMTNDQKRDLVMLFAKWYKEFLNHWSYSEYDVNLFEEKVQILKGFISQSNDWGQNVKKMKVSFEKSNKILADKIIELERSI